MGNDDIRGSGNGNGNGKLLTESITSMELSWSKFNVANLEYVGIIIFRLSGSLSFRYSVDDNLDQ